MTTRSLDDILQSAIEALSLRLDDRQQAHLLDYVELLVRWNRTYNLTAVREPAAMMTQHIADSLAVVPPLRARLSVDDGAKCLLDVGSGAGLPGVVLAVALPELDVTCVDSVGKKAAFIAQAAATLGLPNLTSRHARVEALTGGAYDVVVSRAFSSLSQLIDSTRHLLADGGQWLAMKGLTPTLELQDVGADVAFHVEQLPVPGLGASRCLVWMQPVRESEHMLLSNARA